MDASTVALIVIGGPLTLVALGFFLLCLRFFLRRGQREEVAKTLETALSLDKKLTAVETRLGALEDILLSSSQHSNNDKLNKFDRELNGEG
ncbi:MAG: hypothetical protein LBV23_08475 [Deltaproteobacteria bacterium]|jgi:hypothetical protein|nr:hypothetical protein [Deltaproteobacteria bacterium]